MKEVVIVEGIRTPFVRAGAELQKMSAVDLGVRAFQEVIAKSNIDPKEIDEVFIGNIAQPADSANIARVIALFAGVNESVPALTVQRNCASGMEAIAQGFHSIQSGRSKVVIAGGTESMSQIPFFFSEELKNVFTGTMAKSIGKKLQSVMKFRLSQVKPVIALMEGLRDPVSGMMMGLTGERLARDFMISREEQDQFALRSHQRAVAARQKLKEEMVAVYPPGWKKFVEDDIGPRDQQSIEALAKLSPYFEKPHGTITVGNSCPITDGACMLVLMEKEKAKAEGLAILGRIRSVDFAGCDPSRMGLGPVFAAPKALKACGMQMKNMDLIEINEAFAAQVLACVKASGSKDFAKKYLNQEEAVGEIPMDRLNVNGGAIALGHPVGTSGARLVLTILKELRRQGKEYGLASLCIGGGQGGACVVQVEN